MSVLFLQLLNRAGLRVFTILAVAACFAFGSVQAADSGPRQHAEGSYDAASGVYTVVAGDDLSTIAERLGVTVAALKEQNKLRSDTIEIGQKLVVATGVAEGGPASAQALTPDEAKAIAEEAYIRASKSANLL
jgi:arylsulfatase